MKKILVSIILIANINFAKAANEGYTFYNEIADKWQYTYCKAFAKGNTGDPVTVQSVGTQYLNTQVNEREPGTFLGKDDQFSVTNDGKGTFTDERTYGGNVGIDATAAIFKLVGNLAISIKNSFSAEVKVSSVSRTFKGGPEKEGVGLQVYQQFAGRRVGTFCLKLEWVPDGNKIWGWQPMKVGEPGPHPDGYIFDEDKYQWWWANWKFVPNAVSDNSTIAAVQGFPALQWGKDFYQQGRQGFRADNKTYLNIAMNGSAEFANLDGLAFTLVDESGSKNLVLSGNNYITDKDWQRLETSTFTFKEPIGLSGSALRAGNYQVPGSGLICHIISGTITMQFKPLIKVLAIDNLIYTTTGLDRITYNKGLDFFCTSPKNEINYKYLKTITAPLPTDQTQPLGYKYW